MPRVNTNTMMITYVAKKAKSEIILVQFSKDFFSQDLKNFLNSSLPLEKDEI
jgi:hypothetical protein